MSLMNNVFAQITPETARTLVQQAAARGLSPEAYLQKLLGISKGEPEELNQAGTAAPFSAAENLGDWRADLEALAEGTEQLATTSCAYTRAEIYFDHD